MKEKQYKRQKTSLQLDPHEENSVVTPNSAFSNAIDHTMLTPTSNLFIRPLDDITPIMTNRKTMEQVISEGRALSAMFDASQP